MHYKYYSERTTEVGHFPLVNKSPSWLSVSVETAAFSQDSLINLDEDSVLTSTAFFLPSSISGTLKTSLEVDYSENLSPPVISFCLAWPLKQLLQENNPSYIWRSERWIRYSREKSRGQSLHPNQSQRTRVRGVTIWKVGIILLQGGQVPM